MNKLEKLLGKKVKLELEGSVIAFDSSENEILVQFDNNEIWFSLDKTKVTENE